MTTWELFNPATGAVVESGLSTDPSARRGDLAVRVFLDPPLVPPFALRAEVLARFNKIDADLAAIKTKLAI